MGDNRWYEGGSWYEPLQREAPKPAEPVKKKKKTWPWVLGGVVAVLALVIGLSLLFGSGEPQQPLELPNFHTQDGAEPGEKQPSKPEGGTKDDGRKKDDDSWLKIPEKEPSYREYFDQLYPQEETTPVTVNIPRGTADLSVSLKLESAPAAELSMAELYERCSPSVVGISGFVEGETGYSWGSGVILTEDGLILTNTHVIEGCDRATVTLFDDREFNAVLIGCDGISDVAVLKIEAEGLPTASFGNSAEIFVGQKVAAIGNPLGESFRMTMTDGIISAISRDVNYNGRTMTLMQTNAALNEGNSGGPLFNMYGQVIGITNMKMISSGVSIEGIGFAIPSSTVETVVNAIVRDGKVVGRVSIGITVGPIPDEAAERYGLPEGLYIVSVSAGSDAEAKGLAKGDILMAINGQKVTATKEVTAIKDQYSVGDELIFQLWRDGEIFEVSVALVDTNDVYG